nr:Embryonic protein like [Ipomoea batatas]
MMNVLALSLVLTTLATAGVLSPPPPEKNQEDVIIKDGHRVVVVEYEKDHGNTKVLISPHESSEDIAAGKGGEKMEEEDDDGSYNHRRRTTAGELVCDAFGRCRRKIAGAFDRTKDTAPEKAEEARGAVSEGLGKVRDTVVDKGRKAAEMAYEAEEEARDAVSEGLGKVRNTVADKGNKAAKKVYEMEEGARDAITERLENLRASAAETAKETAKDAVEKAKGIRTDASRKMEHMKEQLSDRAKKAEEKVGEAKESAKQNILRWAGRAFGMANLIGLAIAYGMSVWVTFISSYVLARALPRQQFAMAQSKIYPVYFKAMAYSIGTAFLGHLLSQTQRLHSKTTQQFLGFNLLFSLVMVLVNLLYLEPRATKHGGGDGVNPPAGAVRTATATEIAEKKQRERAEEAAGKSSEMVRLSRKLKNLNSYSSFLNVVTLMSLTLYLADIGQRLHVACTIPARHNHQPPSSSSHTCNPLSPVAPSRLSKQQIRVSDQTTTVPMWRNSDDGHWLLCRLRRNDGGGDRAVD